MTPPIEPISVEQFDFSDIGALLRRVISKLNAILKDLERARDALPAGTVGQPILTPSPGSFEDLANVTAFSPTSGAIMRFTRDGTDPVETSEVYTGPVPITATTTLRFRAWKTGLSPSSIVGGIYDVVVPAPVDWDENRRMREPLGPSTRALITQGLIRHLAANGDDVGGDGSAQNPWRTWAPAKIHAAANPDDERTYYHHGAAGLFDWYGADIVWDVPGKESAPINLLGYPGEPRATFAFERPEFRDTPATAWEPSGKAGAHPDEYWSTSEYPNQISAQGGHFATTMIPLAAYKKLADLRSSNEYQIGGLGNYQDNPTGLWTGPGLMYDPETRRFLIRLSPTTLPGRIGYNYVGTKDPRTIPLIINRKGAGAALIFDAPHVHFGEIAFRGADETPEIRKPKNRWVGVEHYHTIRDSILTRPVDPIKGYDGSDFVEEDCIFHGCTAPWISRFAQKNRLEMRTYMGDFRAPNPKFIRTQWIDGHDGPTFSKEVAEWDFLWCLIENMTDDGLDGIGRTASGVKEFRLSKIRGAHTYMSMAGPPEANVEGEGHGFHMYRAELHCHVRTYGGPPSGPDDPNQGGWHTTPRILGEHGGGNYNPSITASHVTIFHSGDMGGSGNFYIGPLSSKYKGAKRRLKNILFLQVDRTPSQFVPDDTDLGGVIELGGNLIWSLLGGAPEAYPGEVTPDPRVGDVHADPQLVTPLDQEATWLVDTTGVPILKATSLAIGAGQILDASYRDVPSLQALDAELSKPTIGAIPKGFSGILTGPKSTVVVE